MSKELSVESINRLKDVVGRLTGKTCEIRVLFGRQINVSSGNLTIYMRTHPTLTVANLDVGMYRMRRATKIFEVLKEICISEGIEYIAVENVLPESMLRFCRKLGMEETTGGFDFVRNFKYYVGGK